MRIVSLELENTKSYAKGKVEFTDGVNAIVGHNGAGKSTVLEAIGFALFDCLAGYKQSDFIREGAK
ncbi:MAG: AAA family ATPase, partial [Caldilineaceae bacterium]|nr:AAA family ATPase [Caldilineaceae bacterium]